MSVVIKPSCLKEVNGFTSLASFPKNFCFNDQNKDEYILLFMRQHKIILFFNLLIKLLLALSPFLIEFIFTWLDNTLLNGFLKNYLFFDSKWWLIILLAWIALVLSFIFDTFYRWFYNINVLTNERFVDIDLESIFSSRVEVASLFDIQDVKDSQNGVIQSLFNMGDLTVLTASGVTVFNLNNIPKAHIVRDFISDVMIKVKKLNIQKESSKN